MRMLQWQGRTYGYLRFKNCHRPKIVICERGLLEAGCQGYAPKAKNSVVVGAVLATELHQQEVRQVMVDSS